MVYQIWRLRGTSRNLQIIKIKNKTKKVVAFTPICGILWHNNTFWDYKIISGVVIHFVYKIWGLRSTTRNFLILKFYRLCGCYTQFWYYNKLWDCKTWYNKSGDLEAL